MHVAVLGHGADARDQGLGGHLAAEHPLAVGLRLASPEQVDVERLDVEERDELVGGGGHRVSLLGRVQLSVGLSGLSSPARNCSNCRPISSPVGRGWLPARRLLPLSSARVNASYCCSSAVTTSPTSSLAAR